MGLDTGLLLGWMNCLRPFMNAVQYFTEERDSDSQILLQFPSHNDMSQEISISKHKSL